MFTRDHESLAQRLTASLHAEPRLCVPEGCTPPTREQAGELLEALLGLVFPGYFGTAPRDITRDRIAKLAAAIETQIRGLCSSGDAQWPSVQADDFLAALPTLRQLISLDVQAAIDGDPSCKDAREAILCLPGVLAVTIHRLAHQLLRQGVPVLPRIMSAIALDRTGIDIHPAARIGRSFFIDHGAGVVIGETARIGDHGKLYQGVTLGARSFHYNERRQIERNPKRHPTLEDHVTVYANATILGGDTVIGAGSVIGAGVLITASIPPGHLATAAAPDVTLRTNLDRPPSSFSI